MVILHRKEDDLESDHLEQELNRLVISFRKINHEENDGKFPYIEEDGKEFREEKEIKEWLNELESELNWQRSLSGDGCYIDPKNGTVC